MDNETILILNDPSEIADLEFPQVRHTAAYLRYIARLLEEIAGLKSTVEYYKRREQERQNAHKDQMSRLRKKKAAAAKQPVKNTDEPVS